MRFVLSRLLLLVVVACGEVKEGTVDSGAGSFTLEVTQDDAFVRQSGTIALDVTVVRTGPGDDIVVMLDNAPAGVTAAPLTIASGATTGTLTLDVAASAAQGRISIGIVGTAGTATDDDAVALLIGGRPGTLDQSFDDDGIVMPTLAGSSMVGRGATIDSEGRVVVTGIVMSSPTQALVVRLLEDGTLDPNFGSSGVVSSGLGPIAQGIVVKTTADAVFVAGIAGGASVNDNNFGLFRYTNAGVLDGNFGVGGIVSLDPGGTQFTGELRTLDVSSDGSLLISGQTYPAAGGVTVVGYRYSQGGVRDTSFNLVAPDGNVYSSAVQPDGKLVLAGMSDVEFIVSRFQASGGGPDMGFGQTNGHVLTGFQPSNADAYGVAVLPDGKILAVGIASGAGNVICLARYNTNGSIDVTFGTAGKITTTIPFESPAMNALVVVGSKLYFVGRVGVLPAVARLNLDGTADSTFGSGGVATVDFGVSAGTSFTTGGYGLAIDAEGRIVISAELGAAPDQRLGVARLWQ